MKLFRLIKSIDYVSYPIYKELVKISNTINNSIGNLRDIIISTIIGILLDSSSLSQNVACKLITLFPCGTFVKVYSWLGVNGMGRILSFSLVVFVFLLLRLCAFVKDLFKSNKDTKEKRDILAFEFYNVVLPQLKEIESMIEEINETNKDANNDLLILRAKHEACDLYKTVFNMKVFEYDSKKQQTKASEIMIQRIGKDAYELFIKELLETMVVIYTLLKGSDYDDASDEIKATFNQTGVFDVVEGLNTRLAEVRKRINQQNG